MLTLQTPDGQLINSIGNWRRLAPPKQPAHWKPCRSAMELAKAWFRTGTAAMPVELLDLLNSNEATRGFEAETVIPEKKVQIDEFRGERPSLDLVIRGVVGERRVLVAIEAKADEWFGPQLKQRSTQRTGTNATSRTELLAHALFDRLPNVELGELRYQLLTGVAATLAEAKNWDATCAVFVFHEFVSHCTSEKNRARNQHDFERFVHVLPDLRQSVVAANVLYGPSLVRGTSRARGASAEEQCIPDDIPLFIGKIETHLPVIVEGA